MYDAYSQTMSLARTANLLGAIALGLADDILETAERHVAHGGCTPAALCVIGHEPGLSINFLARVLRMSHPGTVRLVDRLEADGLIQRRPNKDGRTVALHLTVSGQKRRIKLLANRRTALEQAIKRLSRCEREELVLLLEKLLIGMKKDPLQVYTICRLCEDTVCVPCPMTGGNEG
jgi:MarR family transcriptional regulator, negative regulator of the multidrug operon emrRAB